MAIERVFIPDSNNNIIEQATRLLINAKYAIAFTGAGISTPSGIPDFRSPQSGLWNHSDPLKVASIWAFHKSPKDFFDWIRPLAINAESARPNSAHSCLSHLENIGIIKAVITQNIDGLHQKAGSQNVLELHGSAQTATCSACGKKHSREHFHRMITQSEEFPVCSKCHKIIKPDVVLFGESLPQDTWDKAYQACLLADLILIAGSSLEVSPANSLPEIALMNGAKLIINNLGQTYLDERAEVLLKMDVEQGVGKLAEYFL
ncbi:MAG: NAD-dependent deacylase [Anaerolineaceae bacterium]|nr:NAD-dependent deacylase [Anaerolineaceae bacterium]